MCNLNEKEDAFHFICVCPVLSEFRLIAFGRSSMTRDSALRILNGPDWSALVEFCRLACRYRKFLVTQYNVRAEVDFDVN